MDMDWNAVVGKAQIRMAEPEAPGSRRPIADASVTDAISADLNPVQAAIDAAKARRDAIDMKADYASWSAADDAFMLLVKATFPPEVAEPPPLDAEMEVIMERVVKAMENDDDATAGAAYAEYCQLVCERYPAYADLYQPLSGPLLSAGDQAS